MAQRSRNLYQNPLSRFAGVMAIMVFAITAVLLFLDYSGVRLSTIIGIFTYTIFPALLFFYLALIPVGMYREWRRLNKHEGEEHPAFPRFDFNVRTQRIQLYVFIFGTSLVGLLALAAGYRAYEFTESVPFCADLCHKVMEPEAVTYRNSPHARVECVNCHVGKGATWYMKSKISGLYQVYATLFNKYPRPIETPIEDLRPSAETCEQCHWPSKFYGAKQVLKTHYQPDEQNTPRQFLMLMNIGGGISPTGIHWHVGKDEVFYVPRDRKRQDIPWVKVKYQDGRESIYTDTISPPDSELLAKTETRKMDCMDCHNRPTHIFHSPAEALDEAISEGRISGELPFAKKIGLDVLSINYATAKEAGDSIRSATLAFYREKYPALAAEKARLIEKTITEFAQIWSVNNFPRMKSNWAAYPNNLEHLRWPGCFRCHDGNHKNEKGKAIKKDCNICHVFLDEKLSGELTTQAALSLPFRHPADVGGEEERLPCVTCHK